MSVEIIREHENAITIKCAFCRGKGTDPFNLLSEFSHCQVCGGRCEVTVNKPAIECAYCKGRGIHRHRRLTCTVCSGKGMVSIKEPTETCPVCKGKGVSTGDGLPCLKCKGKGVITTGGGG
jgi:DnaJ-class molecular chaperone